MTNESKSAGGWNFRLAVTFLAIALALLTFEGFYYFSAPPLDEEQKMLLTWEGVRSPDFSVTTIDGQTIHLADLKGKRVILNFWATWCVPCQVELPDFLKFRAETSTNVVVIGLSTEDEETLRTFVKRAGINYPIALLKQIPSPFQDVVTMPTTIVIDRNGVIQKFLFNAQNLKSLEKFANETDFSGTVKSSPDALK